MTKGGRAGRHMGSRTHGRGKKSGRGAGKRGGRGNAGLWKHRKVWFIKYAPQHKGMFGFTRHSAVRPSSRTVNVGQLEQLVGVEGALDLEAMGYSKLLGAGRISRSIEVRVARATARAVEKVEAAGGRIVFLDDNED